MSKYIPGNQKHLTLENRIYIENSPNKSCTFKDIAKYLYKDPTTISGEVKTHRLSDWYHKDTFYNAKNFYVHRYHCKKTNVCGKILVCGIKCASCPTCNQTCPDFDRERCSRLDKAPYICNGCDKKINHCSHKTQITHRSVFTGRSYADFLSLNPDVHVEMDTVRSSRESKKTLLTFFFPKEKLFLAFLINRCTKGAVRLVFDHLEKRLGTYGFLSLFEHLLTDRGSEFGDPESLETGVEGIQRTSIYYCAPMRRGQKGGVENVHTMLRMVLPKGTSFEYLTQWDVNLILNHINSTPGKVWMQKHLKTLRWNHSVKIP